MTDSIWLQNITWEEIEGSHMWYCYPNLVKMAREIDTPQRPKHLYSVDPKNRDDIPCHVPGSVAEMRELADESGRPAGEPSKA